MDPADEVSRWDKLSPQARRGLERAAVERQQMIADACRARVPIVNNWEVARLDSAFSGDPMIAAGRGDARAALESGAGQHLRTSRSSTAVGARLDGRQPVRDPLRHRRLR